MFSFTYKNIKHINILNNSSGYWNYDKTYHLLIIYRKFLSFLSIHLLMNI